MNALSIMYHDVVEPGQYASSGMAGGGAGAYKLEREDFEQHLRAIHQAVGQTRVRLIANCADWGPECPVFLTFDDGGVSAYTCIADALERYGWRGHFFVTTDWIGRREFLSESQIRELRRRGHVVGSHSCSHPRRISELPPEQILREWQASAQRLADILSEPVQVASVPGGFYSRAVGEAAATAGIQSLFTSEPTAKVGAVGGCLTLGRYVVQRGMPPAVSAALAAGRFWPRSRQALWWAAKKLAKRTAGDSYARLRERALSEDGKKQS